MLNPLSGRRLLQFSGHGVAAAIAGPAAGAALAVESRTLAADSSTRAAATPKQALRLLIAGNRRWVAGRVRHPHQAVARRDALAHTLTYRRSSMRYAPHTTSRSTRLATSSTTWSAPRQS